VEKERNERARISRPVEHPASLSAPSTWRAAALLAAGVAALELVVLVVVILAAFAKPFSNDSDFVAAATLGKKAAKVDASAPAADPVKKKSAPAPVPRLTRNETSVIVLNGNGIQGAADEAAGVVQSLHYLIAGTANAPRTDFARSLVMYRPGYKAEAMRLAKDVRVRRFVPLDGMRAADLQGAHIALILGRQ
jgi:LytR cell envelope-related transcriptional attenuator